MRTVETKPASLAEKIRQIAAKREQQAATESNQATAEELSAAAQGYRALAEAVARMPAGQAALAPFVDGAAGGATRADLRDAPVPETAIAVPAPPENITENLPLAAPKTPEPEKPQPKKLKEAAVAPASPKANGSEKANRAEPVVRNGALTPTPRVRISQQLRPPARTD